MSYLLFVNLVTTKRIFYHVTKWKKLNSSELQRFDNPDKPHVSSPKLYFRKISRATKIDIYDTKLNAQYDTNNKPQLLFIRMK